MPKKTVYQEKKELIRKKKAVAMYEQGLTLREIGKIVERSHEWVRTAIKDLTKNDKGV